MTSSLSALSSDDLLAALQIHYEWGVDSVVEEEAWQPLAPEIPQLVKPAIEAKNEAGFSASPPTPSSPSVRPSLPSTSPEALLSARDLSELVRLSEHLDGVTLSRTAFHRLTPRYVHDAPFMVVGEVPNADEDRSGTLFAGQAGEILDSVLASVGLHRDQLSMVPAIPWRPPGGQRVSERDVKACLPLLQRSITLGRPVRLVTMGTTPMRMLLNTSERLSRVRGQWREVRLPGLEAPLPVFPMLHPLQLMGPPLLRRHFWRDLLELTASLP